MKNSTVSFILSTHLESCHIPLDRFGVSCRVLDRYMNLVSEMSPEDDSERTLLADRGGFWMEDWHMVPLRPELRKLDGVEMVEVPLS